jgi:hypothetical protein
MLVKLPRWGFYKLRPAHLIMLVPKFGKINLMINVPISGHLVVFFTSSQH